MAVSATFVADFNSFLSQAKAAEASLENLATAAGLTEKKVDKVAHSFSGESIIANATKVTMAVEGIGGASKLTDSEMARVNRTVSEALEKMAKLGIEAPANMRELAAATATVPPAMGAATTATSLLKTALASLAVYLGPAAILGAVVGLAKGALDMGDELVKASDKTGITTDALQQLAYVADQSGNTLDEMTSAISQMQNRLAEGDKSAVAALDKLNINLGDLRDMRPEEQFYAISSAVGDITDPMTRTQLAMDLFGKSGAAILPTLRADIRGLADEAPRMSDAAVKGLDQFGDMISKVWLWLKTIVGETLGYIFEGFNILYDRMSRGFRAMGAAIEGDFRGALDTLTGLSDVTLPKVATATTTTATEMQKASIGVNALTRSTSENAVEQLRIKTFIDQTNKTVEQHVKVVEKAEDAQKKWLASVKNLNTVFVPLKSAIDDVGESLHDLPSQSLADAARESAAAAAEMKKFQMETGATVPVVQALGAGLEDTGQKTSKFAGLLAGLPQAIVSAIQGGGSVIGAAGATLGTNLVAKFSEKYGPAIKSALPFGIGEAVVALLPTLGALFGPVAEKIAGFFKSIFSGPSQDELRGRQAVADFEKQLASLLNQTQLNEAGNESWKKTVIAIRDAYIAAGLSEQEALRDAERLWQSSKDGGAASQKVIDEITAKMKGLGDQTQTTTDASASGFDGVKAAADNVAAAVGGVFGQVEGINKALDRLDRDISTTVTVRHIDTYESIDYGTRSAEGDQGFANGTMGRFGRWFANFGAGTRTVLHGNEAVIRPDQAAAFAADMGGDVAGEIAALRSDMQAVIPRAISRAVRDALQLSGAMA